MRSLVPVPSLRCSWSSRGVARAAALAVSGVALLAGCGLGGGDDAPNAAFPDGSTYVALGDSYSAGPFIPTTDLSTGCLRSDHNYPSLVAEALEIERFVDVTCSGATTDAITPGGTWTGPQLLAVDAGADLVTVGIGGNDLDLFGTVVRTCTRLRDVDPDGAPCRRRLAQEGRDLATIATTISGNVQASLEAVKERAPEATVALVGYPRLVPDSGTCPALPLADGDYAEGRRMAQALDRALREAAERAEVRFVDMYAASEGHDVCSIDPWVNGARTDRDKALAYHPLEDGMRAMTAEVLKALPTR